MRYAIETLKPVPATTRCTAERKRVRNKWSVKRAAYACGVQRGVWYRVMAGERVTVATRERFKAFVRA